MRVIMYRTPGIQKRTINSHTRRLKWQEEGVGCWWGRQGGGTVILLLTTQAVALGKLRTNSLF